MTIRLGIMGDGSVQLPYVQSGYVQGFALAAITGHDETRIKLLRQATGEEFTYGCSPRSLIENQNVDAVLFEPSDGLCIEHLYDAVAAGKPVLCEVPLARSIGDIAKLQEVLLLASVEDVPIMGCYPRREPHHKTGYPYEWTKRSLSHFASMYGRVIHVQLDFSYEKPSTARGEQRNMLQDHFPHQLDFLMWLFEDNRIKATRLVDSPTHYSVGGGVNESISFSCMGTRLEDEPIHAETITIRFAHATMVVDAFSGIVTITQRGDISRATNISIEPVNQSVQYGALMDKFNKAIKAKLYDPSLASHLLRVATATVELTGPLGNTPPYPA